MLQEATPQDKALFVVMIMRTEYLNSFLETAHAAMFRDPITVGALSHEQLVMAIARPAKRAGLRFEAGLPAMMVEDAGTADGLPLLAFALQQLYLEAGTDGVVTLEEYRRLGGVEGILVRQADRVRAELRASDPDAPVLVTLLELASVGDHGPATRNVPIGDFDAAGQHVLDAFIEARLLTTALHDGQVMVQVAHEALLRRWPPLRQAIGWPPQRPGSACLTPRPGAPVRFQTLQERPSLLYATSTKKTEVAEKSKWPAPTAHRLIDWVTTHAARHQ